MNRENLRTLYLVVRRPILKIASRFVRVENFRLRLDHDNVGKILIICQPRLGDNVLSQPAFGALRTRYGKAELVGLCNGYVREFLIETGVVDRAVLDPGRGLRSFLGTIRRLRQERFDLVVDLTTDFTLRPALVAFFSNSAYTIGCDAQGRGFLFSKHVPAPDRLIHEAAELSRIVESLGVVIPSTVPALKASGRICKEVEAFFQKENIGRNDVVIALQPSGHYPTQRWPARNFAALADLLSNQAKVVLLEADADGKRAHEIGELMRSELCIYHSESLGALMAFLKRCSVFVCNNSGTLHLASALGVPTVSTMGPTVPERWWPLGDRNIVVRKNLPCMPCNSGICRIKTHDCMNLISVEEVFDAVGRAIQLG
jgi:lipopolysaccharide heptosyltransferase II